jgi:hypothetical protein
MRRCFVSPDSSFQLPDRNPAFLVVFKSGMDYSVLVRLMLCLSRLTPVVLGLATVTVTGLADTADNPYRVIPERNAFGLKSPTPVTNSAPEVVVKTDLKLTGIAKVNGVKKAYLATLDPENKASGQFRYYEMKESRPNDPYVRDGIEVLEIDEAKQTVKVRQGGSELVLDFEKHGFKPTAAPTPPQTPGRPGTVPPAPAPPPITAAAAAGPVPAPVVISRGAPAPGPSGGTPIIPALPVSQDFFSGQEPRKLEGSSSGLTRIPSRQVRIPSTPSGSPDTGAAQVQMNPEEQYIRMEAIRKAAEQRGIVLPPTPPVLGMPTEGDHEPPPAPAP